MALPKIEWFKEGREVPRDRQTYKDGLCQLIIDATGPDDSAKYTCRATTELGTTDTSATLRVKGASIQSYVCGGVRNLKLNPREMADP